MSVEHGQLVDVEPTTGTADPEPAACRPFRISDAMILIAGLAIVLAMGGHLFSWCALYVAQVCRTVVGHHDELWDNWPRVWRLIQEPVRQIVSYGFQAMGTLVVGMTPIFFILRLRSPRAPWRSLLVQPGMVAALAMVFGLFWVTGLVHMLIPGNIDAITGPWIVVGGTVAAAWVTLALIRKWKAEPGWADRMGRILGAIAIGNALLGYMVYRI
jgi:hypothetical protein